MYNNRGNIFSYTNLYDGSDELNPAIVHFQIQAKYFFEGQLTKLKSIKPEDITKHINYLSNEIQELEREGFFAQQEDHVRNSIKQDLKEHLYYTLLSQCRNYEYNDMRSIWDNLDTKLTMLTSLQQRLPKNLITQSDVIGHYFTRQFWVELEAGSYSLSNIKRTFLECNKIIENKEDKITLVTEDVTSALLANAFNMEDSALKEVAQEFQRLRQELLTDTNAVEAVFTNEASFIRGVEILAFVKKYIKMDLYPKYQKLEELTEFLHKHKFLESSIEQVIQSQYLFYKYKIYSYYNNFFENRFIKFCADYLDNNEQMQIIEINGKENERYQEECSRIENDPDSTEWGNYRIIYPEKPVMTRPNKDNNPHNIKYRHKVFSEPDNLEYLMEYCSDEEGLSWLVHEKCEHSCEISGLALNKIIWENKDDNIESAILLYCMHTVFMDHHFPAVIGSEPFIARTYIETLTNLSVGGIQSSYQAYTNALEGVYKSLQKYFIRTPDAIFKYMENFYALPTDFHNAIEQGDYLQAQKKWYAFCRLIFFTNAFLDDPKHASNSDPRAIIPMQASIEKNLKESAETTGKLLIITPTTDNMRLYYKAKNDNKFAQIDLKADIHHLQNTAKVIQSTMGDLVPSDCHYREQVLEDIKKTNIVLGNLYFLTTDRPYSSDSTAEHKRIFIKVPLNFGKYKNKLLSKDYKDEVNKKSLSDSVDEIELLSDKLFKDGGGIRGLQAKKEVKAGEICFVEGNYQVSRYDSEPLMLLALNDVDNIKEIIENFRSNLCKKLELPQLVGKHKVYAILLVTYSDNSTCDICTVKLIGNQLSENSFIQKLVEALNSSEQQGFFVNEPAKLKMATIVASGKAYSEHAKKLDNIELTYDHTIKKRNKQKQEDDITEEVIKGPREQYGRLYLPDGIDLRSYLEHNKNSIIEYFGIPTSYSEEVCLENTAFMSGAKEAKFMAESFEDNFFVDEVNKSINGLYGEVQEWKDTSKFFPILGVNGDPLYEY